MIIYIFKKKKTNDIVYVLRLSQDYPNCRTDLNLQLLKFISLKVGRYLLCRSYNTFYHSTQFPIIIFKTSYHLIRFYT